MRAGTFRRTRGGTRVAAISRRRKRVLTRIRGWNIRGPQRRDSSEKARPRVSVMRGRWRAGFGRTYLASCLTHRVRARRRVLDDRLERHLRSGAQRLPRSARPTRDLGFKNPRRALRERAVRWSDARRTRRQDRRTGVACLLRRRCVRRRIRFSARVPSGGTQECTPREKGDRGESEWRETISRGQFCPISAFSSSLGARITGKEIGFTGRREISRGESLDARRA